MKKTIIWAMILFVSTSSFSQQANPEKYITHEDYMQKSRNQKSGALVLLAGGTALIVTGVLIGNGKGASFGDAAAGGVIGTIGVLSAIGSIPLFIASAKNKRRGNAVTAYFKTEGVSGIRRFSKDGIFFLALSVKICLQ